MSKTAGIPIRSACCCCMCFPRLSHKAEIPEELPEYLFPVPGGLIIRQAVLFTLRLHEDAAAE